VRPWPQVGYSPCMSDQPQHEHGAGKTGGLPGANADPANAELPDDERDDTVSMSDVAPMEDDGRDSTAP